MTAFVVRGPESKKTARSPVAHGAQRDATAVGAAVVAHGHEVRLAGGTRAHHDTEVTAPHGHITHLRRRVESAVGLHDRLHGGRVARVREHATDARGLHHTVPERRAVGVLNSRRHAKLSSRLTINDPRGLVGGLHLLGLGREGLRVEARHAARAAAAVTAAWRGRGGITTGRIGSLKVRANSKSRSSCAGTAMIAPVP